MKTILYCVQIIFVLIVSATADITLDLPNELTAEFDVHIEEIKGNGFEKIVIKEGGKWLNKELINGFPKVSGFLVFTNKETKCLIMLVDGNVKLISTTGGLHFRFYIPASDFLNKIYRPIAKNNFRNSHKKTGTTV